ncbi:cytochrome c oxidase polypeptide vib [Capsaspora owczarzaki ATCC 30864]|uniref:Cytochrome c oxidase subunit n=1 Tax=Capsaspora owczarzaki (strain ATCC 30864) TaxID=595528 RepID=A0A0D2X421_CAPO3|nr:cytochrome c oxidase polypeptide vib [Capsaspora owczarzaki ATCC 30864]KJE95299.1 cytochrome c oxidase polypeptide vib [Capsaspora owczarzaki ATCC 30864]|eukprot:XP_004346437.1 cytochrome c oxidase polypeptide vib [Capsaspora owczarzaki ATCC 30864]
MSTTEIKIETIGYDARFPNQNQTKNCWQNFVDYQKCIKAKGEDYAPCKAFKKNYTILCPTAWISAWNDQLEAGTYPGRF